MLILAAGNGVRMGGRKARLIIGGTTLLQAHILRAKEAGCDRVGLVVHPEDLAWARSLGHAIDSSEIDPAGSLARGLQLLQQLRANSLGDGSPADAFVSITPVDAVPLRVDTLQTLSAAMASSVLAATPSFRGRGGHPVLVRPEVLQPYLRGERPLLRDLLSALRQARTRVEVDDPAVGSDLDTPQDVFALTGQGPRFS